jgi:hypothetical protein
LTSSGAYKEDADDFLNNSLVDDIDLMDLDSKIGSSSNGQIMENYLILDRLNQKNQRKQQLKQKQQQINELKQKQLELELKMNQQKLHDEYKMRNTSELDHLNSKLTSHYSLKANYLNNNYNVNNNLKPVNNTMSNNSTLSSSPSSFFTNSNNSNYDSKRQMDQFIQNSHEIIGNQVNNLKETDIINTTINNSVRSNTINSGTGIFSNNNSTASNKNNEKINRRSKTPVRFHLIIYFSFCIIYF